jgi:feruloyl-CoA synthase
MFAAPAMEIEHRGNGVAVLRSSEVLEKYARCTGEYLEHWATSAPTRPFLMERSATRRWEGVTYGEALEQARCIGAWLLEQNLSAERPVAVLSENSVEHGLLMLASLHVGVPVAPISPAYSLRSKDFVKLRAIIATLRPGVIFVSDQGRFASALGAVCRLHDGKIVVGSGSSAVEGALTFESLRAARDVSATERAFSAISPDTIAKFMFTSGSTDEPKGVVNTQRMLCSNQQAMAQIWPFIDDTPVLVDWLPWHHTFGGNQNFNIALRNGGTLYIDGGRPLHENFDETLANLRDVAPTVHFNVPRAYDLLVAALGDDTTLRQHFFSRLQVLFYAGAGLPQNLWEALERLALETLGRKLPIVSSWGLTETAPLATSSHYRADRAGLIGVPIPGCEVKLVPSGDNKLEARVRGPNVTPGYWKRPDLMAKFFDEEGFFKTGDAVRFVDQAHVERGLFFDGRLGENFKLSTAAWVDVGALRLEAIVALAPIAQDIVVTGHDRDEVGLLIFPQLEACRKLCPDLPSDAPAAGVLLHVSIRARVATALAVLARQRGGSSTHATRAMLMTEPPSIDAGEVTDKGYINQRAVLARRAGLIERLYGRPTDPSVITPAQ